MHIYIYIYIYIERERERERGPHVVCPLILLDSNKPEVSILILKIRSNTEFNELAFSGSRVIPYRRTDRRKDMKELTVPLRNFGSVPDHVYIRRKVIK